MPPKKRKRTTVREALTNSGGDIITLQFEPSSRTLTDWTPDLIRSAELLAQGGNLRLAADLCEEMLADDRIKGVLETRVEGLLGLPLTFEEGVGRRKRSAKRQLEAEEDWDASCPEDQLAAVMKSGILLGAGLFQNAWRWRDNGRVIGQIQHYRERFLRYDENDRTWKVLVDPGSEIVITPGDGQWGLYTPGGPSKPWLHGAWRGLSRWWLVKQLARSDWARHSEVHGSPARVAERTDTKTLDTMGVENRRQLAADLASLGRDSGIVLPPGYKLSLIEAVARTWEMFQAQVNMANMAITIILAGQNLTTEVSGGSLAAAQVHKEVRGDKIRMDDQTIATTVHDQNLVHWAGFNFGEPGLAPWPRRQVAPPMNVAEQGDAMGKLADGITKMNTALGNVRDDDGDPVEVDALELLSKAGIPLVKRETPANDSEGQGDTGDGGDSNGDGNGGGSNDGKKKAAPNRPAKQPPSRPTPR